MTNNKIIVLDFDGTVYDIADVIRMSHRNEINFLCAYNRMSRDEAYNFLVSECVITDKPSEAKSATECFMRHGINAHEWSSYRTEHFDVSCIDSEKAVSEEILTGLREFGRLVLLSSNTLQTLKKIAGHININLSVFDKIICSDSSNIKIKFSKKFFMSELIREYNISPQDLISIGDRYHTDIEPALNLGGSGILLNHPSSLKILFEDMKSGMIKHDSESYTYFKFASSVLISQ